MIKNDWEELNYIFFHKKWFINNEGAQREGTGRNLFCQQMITIECRAYHEKKKHWSLKEVAKGAHKKVLSLSLNGLFCDVCKIRLIEMNASFSVPVNI